MPDDLNDILQELSALLRRISDQNDASLKRQDEFRSRMQGQKDPGARFREDADRRREQIQKQMEEFRSNARELADKRREEDVQFRERLLQTLEHHNQLLESLIARLKDTPKKG